MGNVLVLTGKEGMRPFAKNMLRTVALKADCTVRFGRSREQSIQLEDTGSCYFQAKDLFEILRTSDPHTSISPALTEACKDLLGWLGEEACHSVVLNQTTLKVLLEEVRQQSIYYLAGETSPEFEVFWKEWDKRYPRPQSFQITGASVVNNTNKSEADDYLAAHQKASIGVESIDNAIESLLKVLPLDVEFVLDIGSGPGYVNRHLPDDVSVLAMDITETILEGNTRQTCVGDIMNIPLADGSVDMVMACDMLEHLPDDVLKKGMTELERVSRKYLYLQVPFQEDPFMAMAFCPSCRNVWHVNHHKRFFDEQKLTSLVSKGWKPVCVNYTGEVSIRRKELLEAKIARRMGWDVYCVEDAICPNCGGKSKSMGAVERKMLQHIAEFDADCPFPAYTEIGVLFCKADENPELREECTAETQKGVRRERNALVPYAGMQSEQVYTALEMTPEVYTQGCRMQITKGEIHFTRLEESDTAWVAVAFPALMPRYRFIEVTGYAPDGPTAVSVATLDAEGKEVYVREWEWSDQPKTQSLPTFEVYGPVYIKLYFHAKRFVISACRLTGAEDIPYWYYSREKSRGISFKKGGIHYCLFNSHENGICLSHRPEEWVRLTNELDLRQQKALQGFLNAIVGDSSVPATNDNRSLIKQQAGLGSYVESQLSTTDGSIDNRFKQNALPTDGRLMILNSLLATEGLYGTPASGRGMGTAMAVAPHDTRLVIVDSIIAETTMRLYDEIRAPVLKRKAYSLLSRGKRALHGWLRRHSRLYEFLISLGIKEVYFKIKRRIKS